MTLIPSFLCRFDNSASKRSILLLPNDLMYFFELYEGKRFVLRNGRGHTWDVSLKICAAKIKVPFIDEGWLKFVFDNLIGKNYTLVFFNNEPFVFDVVMYVDDGRTGVSLYDFIQENEDNVPAEPFFNVNLNDSDIHQGQIGIPIEFWNNEIVSRGKKKEKIVMFVHRGDKRWNVRVKRGSNGEHCFGGCDEMIDEIKFGVNTGLKVKLLNLPGLHFLQQGLG